MASIGVCGSICTPRRFPCIARKQPVAKAARVSSLGTQQEPNVLASTIDGHQSLTSTQTRSEENTPPPPPNLTAPETSAPKFSDERWKHGTWDLNMFLQRGKIDWHAVISAEAKRRRFLELYPEEATNQEPVMFRSSIVPWWAWITHSHLPEAELLNGRAAMVGFFMSYLVDALTGLDVVGQTGNFVCKAALFITVAGVVLFRRKDDVEKLQKLAEEATFYDKQWQSSWKDQQQNAAD